MKNICIVGTGPAGLYTAKYLLPHFKVTAYERDSQPCGLFRYFYKSDKTHFNNVLNHPNFNLRTNQCVNEFKGNYDAYVVATGAESRNLDVKGQELLIPALNVIKQYKLIDTNENNTIGPLSMRDKDVLIVGCGNVTMDLAKYLFKDAMNIFILCRGGPFEMACANNELRDIYELSNVKINTNVNIKNEMRNFEAKIPEMKRRVIESRKRILEKETDGTKNLNLLFYSNLESLEKINNKLIAVIKTPDFKKRIFVDHAVSSIGFINNPKEFHQADRPLFFTGWVKNPRGNLIDIKNDAYNTAQKIIRLFKK